MTPAFARDGACPKCGSAYCPTLDESYEHSDECCEDGGSDPGCGGCEAEDICLRARYETIDLAAWMTASRARAMVQQRGMAEAVEGMGVDVASPSITGAGLPGQAG